MQTILPDAEVDLKVEYERIRKSIGIYKISK